MSKKVVAIVNIPTSVEGKRLALPGGRFRVVKPLQELYEGDEIIKLYPSLVIMRDSIEKELLIEEPVGEADVVTETEEPALEEPALEEPALEEPVDEEVDDTPSLEEVVAAIKSKQEMDEFGATHGVELDRRKKLAEMKEDFFAALAEK